MKFLLSIACLYALQIAPSLAFAQSPASSRTEFCTKSKDLVWFQKLADDEENHLSFRNHGGIINGGVCWWHSRFTRSANYLAVYRSELPKPTAAEAKALISSIVKNREVVEIPGYSSLREFSHDWETMIQKTLEAWQRNDAAWRLAWIRGLYNSATPNAAKLERTMNTLYEDVEYGHTITYLKIQIPGIPSHAWLITAVAKTEEGYDLRVIDSNYLESLTYHYKTGDDELSVYGGTMPYIEQMRDFPLIDSAVETYCKDHS